VVPQVDGRTSERSNENGVVGFVFDTAPRAFTVVVSRGRAEGKPVHGILRAEVAAYEPDTIVYVNPATTLLERVNKLAELRALRLGQTKSGIVPVLWFALLMIPIVLLGSFALAHDANPRFHYLLVGLVGGAVSLALFVALEIDLPYRGAASVSPGPIALAIQAAQSDDDIALPRN
jgi:hypothetical protein